MIRPIVAFAFALLFAGTVSATTVLKASVQQMTAASQTVIHAVVKSSRAQTVDNNPKHIQTIVALEVRELLRGTRGTRSLQLVLPGGRVGDWAMHIPGMPSFKAGEEVVLFLEKTATNWAISGLSQGKFTVLTDAQGQKTVTRKLDGLHMMVRNEKGALTEYHPRRATPSQTLEGLKAEIRSYLSTDADTEANK